jgi:hypothetical protein
MRSHPVLSFTLLTFAFSWVFFAILPLLFPDRILWLALPALRVGAQGPAVAGLIMAAILNPAPTGIRPAARRRLFCVIAALSLGFCWISRSKWLYPAAGHVLVQWALQASAVLIWAAIISGVLARTEGVRSVMRGLVEWPGWRWMLLLPLFPLLANFAGLFLIGILGSPDGRLLRTSRWPADLPMLAYVLFQELTSGGGNEEPGWRGFMLRQLQKTHSPLVASLVVGAATALLRWPIYFVGAYSSTLLTADVERFVYHLITSVALSLGLAYLYNRPRGGLLLTTWFCVLVDTVLRFALGSTMTQRVITVVLLGCIPLGKMWKKLPPETVAAQRIDEA